MGSLPKDGDPIKLNGAFHTLCWILRFVVASAAESELVALFLNCQEGMIFKTTLEDLGHPQPKIGQAMEMRYFGHVKKMHKKCALLNGTPAWKI